MSINKGLSSTKELTKLGRNRNCLIHIKGNYERKDMSYFHKSGNTLLISLMLILFLSFNISCRDEKKSDAVTDEGMKEYRAGRLEIARQRFEEAIKLNPDNARALNGLGNIAADTKRYKDALDYYDQALKIDTTNPIYSFNKASVYRDQKKYFPALEQITAAEKKVGSKKWIVEYERALTYIAWEKWNPAEESLNNVIKQEKEIDDRNRLGQTYSKLGLVKERKGDYKASLEAYKKALELMPGDTNIQTSYGIILYRMEKYNDALSYLEKIAKNKPQNLVVKMYIGLCLARQEKWKLAEGYLEEVKKADKNAAPETDFFLGRCYMEDKDYKKAIDILSPIVDKYDTFKDLGSIIASCYFKLNDYKKAKEVALTAYNKDKTDILALKVLYLSAVAEKDKAKADEYMTLIKKLKPDIKPEEVVLSK